MKQNGIVTEIDEKGNASVSVKKESACESCRAKDGCFTCKKTVDAKAQNIAGAKIGDEVELETPSSLIVGFSALIFVLPIVVCIVFYFLGFAIFNSGIAACVISLISFILVFVILNITINRKMKKFNPVKITKILDKSENKD